ncbi:hypothetical protein ABW21_db0207302 [Orbilia brochopaga]|nr:hypothetical protein ABW21_db0207302 [Drechslerella brochopaga]
MGDAAWPINMTPVKKFQCDSSISHNPPIGFTVREATYDDIPDMTQVHYSAFNDSYSFWKDLAPEDPVTEQWLGSNWAEGISSDKTKTFVVQDLSKAGKIVAFMRWSLPKQMSDKSRSPSKPEYKYPTRLAEVLWAGGLNNQIEVMGHRPHLKSDHIAVHVDYQGRGLAAMLMHWGCQQADRSGMEIYGNAMGKALPIWTKYFGFKERKTTRIPVPGTTKPFEVVAIVRSPQTLAQNVDLAGHQGLVSSHSFDQNAGILA